MNRNGPHLLRLSEVMSRLNCGKQKARSLLKPIKLGPKTFRYSLAALENLIEKRSVR